MTPSYNQAQFLEETIRSVLLQGYPNLEYIVVDGGSTDGSVEIIKRYAPWIDWWVSERDGGQADALNKGFERSTGELFGFINSDDLLLPNALQRVALAARAVPSNVEPWLCFPVEDFDEGGPRSTATQRTSNRLSEWVRLRASLHQPGVFWSASMHRKVGGFSSRLHCAFDRDLFMRFLAKGWGFSVYPGPPVARFRVHRDSKTTMDGETDFRASTFQNEFDRVSARMLSLLSGAERLDAKKYLARRALVRAGLVDGRYPTPRGWGLFRAAGEFPRILTSRVFWGAARREIMRRVSGEPRQ